MTEADYIRRERKCVVEYDGNETRETAERVAAEQMAGAEQVQPGADR